MVIIGRLVVVVECVFAWLYRQFCMGVARCLVGKSEQFFAHTGLNGRPRGLVYIPLRWHLLRCNDETSAQSRWLDCTVD